MKTRGHFQFISHTIAVSPCSSPLSTASDNNIILSECQRGKKDRLLGRATVYVEFACSLRVCVGFLWDSAFLPQPNHVQLRWIGMATLSQPEWVWLWGLGWKGVFSMAGPTLGHELPGWGRPPSTLNRLENRYLTCFYTPFLIAWIAHFHFNG